MAKAKSFGSGWHKESLRHRNAKIRGRAGGRYHLKYSGLISRPINKTADKIFYYETPDTNFDPENLAIGTTIELEHTKDKEIAKAIAKAHLKEDKDYYEKLIIMENKPRPPITSSEATSLPLQFRITVPSTTDINKKLSPKQFKERIEQVDKDLSLLFGGETTIRAKGGYVTKEGKFIPEGVAIIETSMTESQYKENKSKIEKYLKEKREEWGQETIMFGFEDENYIYPKY